MLKNTEKADNSQNTSENSGVWWANSLRPTSLVSLLFKGPDTLLRFSSVPIKGFIGLMPLPFTLYGSDKKLFLQEKALSFFCTILVAESPIAAWGSRSKFREIENRCAREQHLAVINIIPKVDYDGRTDGRTDDRTDGERERATAERDSNPRFGEGEATTDRLCEYPRRPRTF